MAREAPAGAVRRGPKRSPPPETVDPAWLLKAFAIMVGIALVCAYATLCGLFYRGQWQLVLHPVRTSVAPASIDGARLDKVRFGTAATGVPQLTGWWIPAEPGAPHGQLTMLFLPGGDGSLASDAKRLGELHRAGVPVFAIDYRGYGQSADQHPTEQSMREDADSAWDYLTGSRGLESDRIVPYGRGLGCALALALAESHGSVPAVVLDAPDFEVDRRVRQDPRSRMIPVGLLFHDRFDVTPALAQLRAPKLILSGGDRVDAAAAAKASDPKMTVVLPPDAAPELYAQSLRRFLDEYVLGSGATALVPR